MRFCLSENDVDLSDGDLGLLSYVPAHVCPIRFGGSEESKPTPTGSPPIVHPPTTRLGGFGEGVIARLWIQATARRPCPPGQNAM